MTKLLPPPDEHGNYYLTDGSFIFTSSAHKLAGVSKPKWFILGKFGSEKEVVWAGSHIAYFDDPVEAFKCLTDLQEA